MSGAQTDRRIRVLVAIGSLHGGGSERQIIGILKHLDRTRFEPILYLVYRQGELLAEVPKDVPVHSFADEFQQPRINWPGRLHHAQIKHLAQLLSELEIDLVYDRTFHMTAITGPATRRTGTPRISVIVTDPEKGFAENAGRFQWIKLQKLKRAYREAGRVLAVSEGARQTAISFYGLNDEQVQTCENFVDLDRIDTSQNADAAPVNDSGTFEVIAAGRLHREKGFDVLIHAVDKLVHRRNLKHVRLAIVGVGPEEAELKTLAATLNLEEFVRFEGYQPDLPRRLRQSQLFCLSSRNEGLPNVLLEAMLCRMPVVATDCQATVREILADGQFGPIVPVDDPQALADAIQNTVERGGRSAQELETIRNAALARFGPQTGIERLQQIMLQVLSAPADCHAN